MHTTNIKKIGETIGRKRISCLYYTVMFQTGCFTWILKESQIKILCKTSFISTILLIGNI